MSIQDSFLLDEVRCGFMIPAAVKQAWAASLEVLMEIDRVCKKHNIQYFADWGTLLGTVRHGGFIPWDDDLDIVMKREDYNKFMTVARFDMEEGFDVHTFRNHEDCWLFMGKVVGKNTFCFDKEHLRRFHNFPYIACVDVFVLDYVHRDPEKEKKRRELCKYMLAVADGIGEGKWNASECENSLRMLEDKCGKKISRIKDPVNMRRYLYGEVEKIFGEVDKTEADSLTQIFPWGLIGKDFQFPKEYYEKQIYLPFENTLMPVPMMYDKMLRKRYGDYCRLVKDAGGHNYPFFEGQKKNLQKVLDFKLPEFRFDKKRLFRSKEEETCKGLSYKAMVRDCTDEIWRMKDEISKIINQVLLCKEQESFVQNREEQQTPESNQEAMERVMDLLQTSQQLAIELGNLLEQMMGEDCEVITLLERYCEAVYRIYELLIAEDDVCESGKERERLDAVQMTEDLRRSDNSRMVEACEHLSEIAVEIANVLEEKIFERKTVLFLPVLAKDWKGLEKLWREYLQDDNCDVYVVPMPYYYKDYDGSSRRVCYDAEEFPKEVNVLDYRLLTSEYLEMLHPEVIVIQNPYDSWNPVISLPSMYYAENIRKYTDELVYVSPFTLDEYSKRNEREYFNMKYYVTMPGVVYADRVMVQSENIRQVYIEKLTEFAGKETKDIWEKRVCVPETVSEQSVDGCLRQKKKRLDVMQNEQNIGTNRVQKKKMLYAISYGAYIGDVKVAQEKIERNLQLFETCKEQIELTVQIFPDNEVSDELRSYVKGILKNYSANMLESGTTCCVADYDAYYGDGMPLVMQFRDVGKPVMIQDIYVE